jgi:single-stranded-DNA-specific exonuclease
VTFLVLVATTRELRQRGYYAKGTAEPDLMSELDLVALATVADVVPLTGLNRAYVAQGLQVMRWRRNTGLKALIDAAGLNEVPTPYHLGFILGPRINAGGRIGDAALGSRLLTSEDEVEAGRIALLLDRLNKERRAIEAQMLEEALAEADTLIDARPDMPLLIVGSPDWHKGIVGLVASRLTERFHRPSCVIAWDEEKGWGTGSLRSVAGADIGAAVRAAVAQGHLVKGGGHAMAAGLTVARDKVTAMGEFLDARLAEKVGEARERVGLDIDGALTPGGVTDAFFDLMERVGPFGQGNPSPRFAFPATRIKFAKVVGEAHVRCALESADGGRLDGIAFRAAGRPLGDLLLGTNGLPIHIAGHLKRSTWGGRDKIELIIEDAADPRRQP